MQFVSFRKWVGDVRSTVMFVHTHNTCLGFVGEEMEKNECQVKEKTVTFTHARNTMETFTSR